MTSVRLLLLLLLLSLPPLLLSLPLLPLPLTSISCSCHCRQCASASPTGLDGAGHAVRLSLKYAFRTLNPCPLQPSLRVPSVAASAS